jgi:hypothetical protein
LSGTDDIAKIAAAPIDAPDLRQPTGGAADGEAFDLAELGDDCPIEPLGFLGQKLFFLDFAGQLIPLGTEFRKGELMQLFGTRMGWLDGKWPQWKKVGDKDGKPLFEADGFSQKDAQRALIMACGKQGLFDPKGKVRGRGAHLGTKSELVFHCGNQVIVGGRKGTRDRHLKTASYKPGLVGDFVYPTAPKLAPPADAPATIAATRQLLATLQTWNWKRREIDAHLLLCWVAAALLGGALKVRPHGWIVGPSGAGKTTLQQLLRAVMDDWGIFTEDATEAGVRQLLDQDTLAVMFDEIEAGEDKNETHRKIIGLARLAYSGGSGLRGGQDHVSKQFVARSCFLFSSIHHQQLDAQDRNRIAILSLSAFAEGTKQIVLQEPMLKEMGAGLRRRLIEQWPRYAATLAAYQAEMLKQGYAGREQDTYGTLLACGDLLLHDAAPEAVSDDLNGEGDRCFELVRKLARVLDAVRAEAESTNERALKHLTSHRLPAAGGREQETVGRWITKRVIEAVNGGPGVNGGALEKLKTHGLAVVNLTKTHDVGNGQGGMIEAGGGDHAMFLAIANGTNQGMQEIFEGSTWKGGVWVQAFGLVDGAIVNKKRRFGGPAEGCVLVPLDKVIDVDAARCDAQLLKMEQARQQAEERG